jgi:hypothetical protein
MLEAVIKEVERLTPEQRFDWGLQVIITGLKSALKGSKKIRQSDFIMRPVQFKEPDATRKVGMAESKIEDESEEKIRSFRVDITLVVIGLFLALGVQNIIQFVETASPHISPYFYLAIGVGSLLIVLVLLNSAAKVAGLKFDKRK